MIGSLFISILLIGVAVSLPLANFSVYQYPYNPMLIPSAPAWPTSSCDNIYSQEIVYWGDVLFMFYGGWEGGSNYCHDQIFLASSVDGGVTWRKYSNDENPTPVLPNGGSQHVNDPSIVVRDGKVMMYYTDNLMKNGALTDQVWLATSDYVTNFQKWGLILDVGTQGSWCELNAGRPAVIFDEGIFKMWYDCTGGNTRSVGYATSTDGYHFTNYAGNPLFENGGGIDVKKINGYYYMLQEGRNGASLSFSTDGIHWSNEGTIIPLSGKYYDAYGQVVPSFQVNPNGTLEAIWFGGATNSGWDQNTINIAFPSNRSYPVGGGCTGCVPPGHTCARQCQMDSISDNGICGAPGSTDPGQCCKCFNDGCQACIQNAVDCYEACVKKDIGHATGYCGNPGSTDPNSCCACV